MNPGNGIETLSNNFYIVVPYTFKLMNPGNGIETVVMRSYYRNLHAFQINESWKRD